jgi:hypothetical protein
MAITLGEPMPLKYKVSTTQALENATGKRFCNNCRLYQNILNGKWVKSANGLHRRWKCAACIERAKARLQTVN